MPAAKTNSLQMDLRHRGRSVSICATPTSLGWTWVALVDSLYVLEGEDGAVESAALALADGKQMVKKIIDADTDSRF